MRVWRTLLTAGLMPAAWAAPVVAPAASATVAKPEIELIASDECRPMPEAKPPADCPPSRTPKSFAPPILPFDVPPGDRTAPADIPLPGYHCHWLGPGKRYCHSGMD